MLDGAFSFRQRYTELLVSARAEADCIAQDMKENGDHGHGHGGDCLRQLDKKI